jgi:LPPG:FO 2-phospho-L-lactate transferase
MMRDLGHEVSAAGVARMYRDFAEVFVLDEEDARMAAMVQEMGIRPFVTNTIMATELDKHRLAEGILMLAQRFPGK